MGFYRGSLPNASRVMLKNLYRYPLMIGMPTAIEKTFGSKNKELNKAITGLSIAGVESFILCPVERLKVYFMTLDRNSMQATTSLGQFKYELAQKSLLKELFRGYVPLFTRQAVAWVTFLTCD